MNLNYELQKPYLNQTGCYLTPENIKLIVEGTLEEAENLDNLMNQTYKENQEIVKGNHDLYRKNVEEYVRFLSTNKIDHIKKYDKKGREVYLPHIEKTIESFKKFESISNFKPSFYSNSSLYKDMKVEINNQVLTYDPVEHKHYFLNIHTCVDLWKVFRVIVEKTIKTNKKYIAAVRFFVENNIDGDPSYEEANLIAMNRYLVSLNEFDGDEIDIKCCDECSTWVAGERRCSCGNRRVSWEVDGNFIDGFYHYPQAD